MGAASAPCAGQDRTRPADAEPYTAGWVQIRVHLEQPVTGTTGRGGGVLRCELLKTFHAELPSIRGKSEVVPHCTMARVSDGQSERCHRTTDGPS